MTKRVNLKVLVVDSDFYARRALTSYMAWDRRTRVVAVAGDISGALEFLRSVPEPELPDALILETEIAKTPDRLKVAISHFHDRVPDLITVCLARRPDSRWVQAAFDGGARGYFVRNEIRLGLVTGIIYARTHRFVVTQDVRRAAKAPYDGFIAAAELIPTERDVPEMTERIRQALWLCVIEGMPAQLAADEMGISPHTIRSYIKEGYRILEAHDSSQYPEDMGPIERAFMRFTQVNSPDVEQSDEEDHHDHAENNHSGPNNKKPDQ